MSFVTVVFAVGLPLILLAYGLWVYNHLIQMRNRVNNSWHQVDVELRRRHDLIPAVNDAVKAYMAHEEQLLTHLAAARSAALQAGDDPSHRGPAEDRVTSGFRRVFAVAEAYPDLKASENFMSLQRELSHTEQRLAFSRQFYNDAVANYNTEVELFPKNVFAGLFGFSPKPYFEMNPTEG